MKIKAFISTLTFLGIILLSMGLPTVTKHAEASNPIECGSAIGFWFASGAGGITQITMANSSCAGSGGFCILKTPVTPACSGNGDCADCCHYKYDCTGINLNRIAPIYGCCTKVIPPPADTCSVVGGYLENDCKIGKVCNSTATACETCVSGTGGICFKSADGTQFVNNCCAGYMCPETVSGIVPCIPGNDQVRKLLNTVTGILLPLAVILGMILIIHNGYKLMTSQGDPTKLQEGKDGLTSAIIGLIFVLMAVSILRVIIKALISGDSNPF